MDLFKNWKKIAVASTILLLFCLVVILVLLEHTFYWTANLSLSPKDIGWTFFYLGFISQLLLAYRNMPSSPESKVALVFIPVGMLGFFLPVLVNETDWVGSLILQVVSLIWASAMAIALIFKEKLIPKLTELKLMLFSLMFSYLSFTTPWLSFAFLPSLLCLVVVMFYTFTKFSPGRVVRRLLYIWFLVIWLLFFVVIFSGFFVGFMFSPETKMGISYIDCFFFGMSAFFLVTYVFYLGFLFPFPAESKHSEIFPDVRVLAQRIVSKFEAHNEKPLVALIVFALVVFALILNSIFNLLRPEIVLIYFLGTYGLVEHLPRPPPKVE